ncbi:MAG: hypothetical protein K8U03_22210 [Planctomycetia bacterium]|nr:hypothetical protein [Planctomycetia bacterium]
MDSDEEPQPAARPYFVPENVDFEALPESVKVAFRTIVEPAYAELVLGARNALERSMGASFVFLLAEELLNHFEIGREMDLAQTNAGVDREKRDKTFAQFLKLIGAKNSALNALLRIRKLPPPFRFPEPLI